MSEQTLELPSAVYHAYRWRDWALGIEGANELATIKDYLSFFDTSEIVEYVLPSSVLAGGFPTRLDISLDVLFKQTTTTCIFGPHATELNGVQEGWQQRMHLVEREIKRLRAAWEPDIKDVEQSLAALSKTELKARLKDLVTLLSSQLRILAVWRVPYHKLFRFFDDVMDRLIIPSAVEMDLPRDWKYSPDHEYVDAWMDRLDHTEKGAGEAGPNLVDSYALDQLRQVAQDRTSKRIPILFTHSGKILEALRTARTENPDFFRVKGVSLVQPPQTAFVLSLRRDATASGTLDELSSELERERERCERIAALSDSIRRSIGENLPPSNLHALEKELKELQKLSDRWDALQKIRLVTEAEMGTRTPLVDSLQKLIDETTEDSDRDAFQRVVGEELDKLLQQVNQLQEKVASREPFAPKAALAVDEMTNGVLMASVGQTAAMGRQRKGRVPSAAYPVPFFRFHDLEVIPYVQQTHEALDLLMRAGEAKERRTALAYASMTLKAAERLRDRPESYLLMAVVSLVQEKWLEGSEEAEKGLHSLAAATNTAEFAAVKSELLFARACAIRAHVLATRVHVSSIAAQFLKEAMDGCLDGLEVQETKDPRFLRELAVILASSRQPVFGASKSQRPLSLRIDRARLGKLIHIEPDDGTLELAEKLARKAFTLNEDRGLIEAFFINTYLYIMTDIDFGRLQHGNPIYERERVRLAPRLIEKSGRTDPNFVDTVMWHKYVLSLARKKRGEAWEDLAREATELSDSLQRETPSNRFYLRLINLHREVMQARPKRRQSASTAART